jgi:hypothetical protein
MKKVIGKTSKINENSQNATDGHFNNINSFMALIEFAKRLNVQNKQLEFKIRKLMDHIFLKTLADSIEMT